MANDPSNVFRGVPQGSILGPILFNIFLNDLLLSYTYTQICNFADDNTLYECNYSIELVKQKLKDGLDYVLHWFKNNSLVANPDQFQMMFLGRDVGNKNIELNIDQVTLKNVTQVRLLGVIIDNKLTFERHISNICNSANNKLRALNRIRSYLDTEQCKYLANAYMLSTFQYCNAIWMFCNKKENSKINSIQMRTLRCIYSDQTQTFDELLEHDNSKTIHVKNLQALMIIIYQSLNNLNPTFMQDIFKVKESSYNLRAISSLVLPKCKSIKYGVNSTVFKGSLLWNSLPNEYKQAENLDIFKTKIKRWNGETCTCRTRQSIFIFLMALGH